MNPDGAAQRAERVLVYDLEGGTFDVTLMEIDHNHFSAVATGGDVFLGGTDWDRRVADRVAEEFQARYKSDPRKDPAGMQRLLREAEDTKRALSAREQTTLSFEHAGQGLRLPVSREQFESLTLDLLERTRFTVRSVLKDAGMAWKDVTRVLLVGGSTRMPMVQRMLEQESGLRADRSVSADEAVAHGAAIYAGLLLAARAGQAPKLRIQNVNSHSLGVLAKEPQTGRPRNAVIIPRNSVLPVTRGKLFRTHKENQRSVEIKVIEGGDSTGKNSTPIGRCIIRDLPKGLPEKTPVEVLFTYAENGRLTVQARLPGADRQASTTIERSGGLTDAMLQEWDQRLRRQVELTE